MYHSIVWSRDWFDSSVVDDEARVVFELNTHSLVTCRSPQILLWLNNNGIGAEAAETTSQIVTRRRCELCQVQSESIVRCESRVYHATAAALRKKRVSKRNRSDRLESLLLIVFLVNFYLRSKARSVHN